MTMTTTPPAPLNRDDDDDDCRQHDDYRDHDATTSPMLVGTAADGGGEPSLAGGRGWRWRVNLPLVNISSAWKN
uniref:Uncharacterized protein n=1 Tax=Oryza sativa subsp. japonica TaxID=39947 RepID=Q2QV77_ORYSJ|nr:hypothetical protein LOC_Os12g13760 [Oryza sativa Japonica Group]